MVSGGLIVQIASYLFGARMISGGRGGCKWMQRLPSWHRIEGTRQWTPVSTCLRLSVRKCGARCLFDCVRLWEMAIAPSPFQLLRASGTSFASRASRSDPNSACLVVLRARGLQPWAMGCYHEGPARSCPKGAYSSHRGLH